MACTSAAPAACMVLVARMLFSNGTWSSVVLDAGHEVVLEQFYGDDGPFVGIQQGNQFQVKLVKRYFLVEELHDEWFVGRLEGFAELGENVLIHKLVRSDGIDEVARF